MGVTVGRRVDKTQNPFFPWWRQTIVLPVLCTKVNRSLAGQAALVEDIIEFATVVLVKKNVVPHQRKATGLGVHGHCERGQRTLLPAWAGCSCAYRFAQ